MEDIIARGALSHFIWSIVIIIISIIVALFPYLITLKKRKLFDATKWEATVAEIIDEETYLDGGDYRYGTSDYEMVELKISYSVEGKEYIKYIPVQSGDNVDIYYRTKNPNDFMVKSEFKETVRYSKAKRKLDIPALLMTILLGIILFALGLELLNDSLSNTHYYMMEQKLYII